MKKLLPVVLALALSSSAFALLAPQAPRPKQNEIAADKQRVQEAKRELKAAKKELRQDLKERKDDRKDRREEIREDRKDARNDKTREVEAAR